MPAPGHLPVSSESPQPESRRLEASALVTNRASLPYYKLPKIQPRVVNEAAVFGGEEEIDLNVALPDVAVASFGEPRLLEAVIGIDDRVKVAQSLLATNPWRQICALRIKSQTNRMFVGTGWFIGPKTLATAGHCVFL